MAYLRKKLIRGRPYYYLVECQRVNGRPRVVWQRYIGTPDTLKRILEERSSPKPQKVNHYHFGSLIALWIIAEELNLKEIIDRHTKKRNQQLSVGTYILLIILNRALSPKSKNQIGKWYKRSVLYRLLKIPPSRLKSQNFWDHMSYLGKQEIDSIQTELFEVLTERYQLDIDCLLWDTTNFFTFLEEHKNNRLAQRGRNKQGRHQLRQIGLALLVTRKFHIPLLHSTYEGNTHDSKVFSQSLKELVAKYTLLAKHCKEITLIFDKGNNSSLNLNQIDESEYHFVGSLIPSHHKELLEIPLHQFGKVGNLLVYRLKKEVFGQVRTIIITYNEKLYQKKLKRLLSQIKRRIQELEDFKTEQLNTHKWRTKKVVTEKIEEILSHKETKGLITYQIRKRKGRLYLEYSLCEDALNERKKGFGKNILFTDNHSWETQEIIDAYHSKNSIEEAFKVMHDALMVSFMPMWHWTDQKIRVHAFTCVLALLLLSLLKRRLHQHGLTLSLDEIIDVLDDLREIKLRYPNGEEATLVSERDQLQQRICKILGIERYI